MKRHTQHSRHDREERRLVDAARSIPKIDIHCHTTPRPLPHAACPDASIDAILDQMDRHGIERTVLLASYFPHRGSGISNYRLASWVEEAKPEDDYYAPGGPIEHPNPFALFGSLDFEHYFQQGHAELVELAERGMLSGIKIYTTYQHIDLQGEKLRTILELAKVHDLPMMFHTGVSHTSMSATGKPAFTDMVTASDIVPAAQAYPSVPFIVSHMGKPYFDDLIAAVKRTQNMHTDMSGLIDSIKDRADIPEDIRAIRKFIDKCGPSRLLFGTDFPVQTHEDSILFIEQAMNGYSREDKEAVYYGNARRIIQGQS